MKRPTLTTGATLAQTLLGLALVGTCAYLLLLVRSDAPKPFADPAAFRRSLELAAGLIAPLALLTLAGAYGLWKQRRWGWWLAFVIDLGWLSMFVYSMIDDGLRNVDMTLVAYAAGSLLPMLLLLVPDVRRFYWASSHS